MRVFGAQAQATRVFGQMLPNLSVVDRQKVWVGAYEREREICMRVFGAQATRKPLHHMRILVGANPIISQRNNKRISSKFNKLNKKGATKIVGIIISTAKWSIPSPTWRYLSTYYYYEIWRWYIHLKIAFLSNLIWKSKALPQISVSLSWCHLFVNFFFNQKGCISSPIWPQTVSSYQNVKEEKKAHPAALFQISWGDVW